MKDDIFNHAEARPEWDYYDIYQSADGLQYYRRTMAQLHRYESLYGAQTSGQWSYTAHKAVKLVEGEWTDDETELKSAEG